MTEPENPKSTRRAVPAVTKAIAIIRYFGRTSEPTGVNSIARELGMVPSTCLHILRVLQDEGLVEFDANSKRYSVGVGILPLARAAIQRNPFSALAQSKLAKLSDKFGVTAIATQLTKPAQMVVVALAHSQQPFRLQVDLGSRFPLHISATGRLFAAFSGEDPSTLRENFDRLVWEHPPTFDEWYEQVEQCRMNGFGVDQGNYISGVTVVAVPLFRSNGQMDRSLVAIGISEGLQSGKIKTLAKNLTKIRDEIVDLQVIAGLEK